ncbi:MAG: hypothetical protein ABI644_15020 [Arenimonas sp.]
MATLQRHSFLLMLGLATLAGCSKSEAPPQVSASMPVPKAAPVAKQMVLDLTPKRLQALAPLAGKSPVIFGEAPSGSYNWRFGPSEDDLVIWASYEAAWSATEFSSVILTSGYTIESDLSQQLNIAAAILAMDKSDLEKKIMPTQTMDGQNVKVFGKGEFSNNGLRVHYNFEDQTGINGHHKPDLMIAILPETFRNFSIEQAKKKGK